MKHLLFLAVIAFSACSHTPTFEERVRPTLDDYFKKNIDDAAGYEFVSIEEVDTLTFNEFRRFELKLLDMRLGFKKDRTKDMEDLEKAANQLLRWEPNHYEANDAVNEVKDWRKEMAIITAKQDSFKNTLLNDDSSKIKDIHMFYKFRAKNSTGALELNKYYVRLNPDLSFLSVSKETKKE